MIGRFVLNAQKKGQYDAVTARKVYRKAKKLAIDGWVVIWKTPVVNKSCANTVLCVQVDASRFLKAFLQRSQQLVKMAKNVAARLRNAGDEKSAKQLIKRVNELHAANIKEVAALPQTTSSCTVP